MAKGARSKWKKKTKALRAVKEGPAVAARLERLAGKLRLCAKGGIAKVPSQDPNPNFTHAPPRLGKNEPLALKPLGTRIVTYAPGAPRPDDTRVHAQHPSRVGEAAFKPAPSAAAVAGAARPEGEESDDDNDNEDSDDDGAIVMNIGDGHGASADGGSRRPAPTRIASMTNARRMGTVVDARRVERDAVKRSGAAGAKMDRDHKVQRLVASSNAKRGKGRTSQ